MGLGISDHELGVYGSQHHVTNPLHSNKRPAGVLGLGPGLGLLIVGDRVRVRVGVRVRVRVRVFGSTSRIMYDRGLFTHDR